MEARYRRVLVKISGEMLGGPEGNGIAPEVLSAFAEEIHDVAKLGCQTSVVIGGGNFFRGLAGQSKGIDRTTGDFMGMLGTTINALALQDALEKRGCHTRVMSALQMHQVCEPYIRRRATRHLEKGRVVIFAAGTGNPYFSTDTAAALRAAEIGAEIILKATKVDGVYDKDPVKHSDAVRFEQISQREALQRDLKVMDAAAISLCIENNIPIVVFALRKGTISAAVRGERIGTLVSIDA